MTLGAIRTFDTPLQEMRQVILWESHDRARPDELSSTQIARPFSERQGDWKFDTLHMAFTVPAASAKAVPREQRRSCGKGPAGPVGTGHLQATREAQVHVSISLVAALHFFRASVSRGVDKGAQRLLVKDRTERAKPSIRI